MASLRTSKEGVSFPPRRCIARNVQPPTGWHLRTLAKRNGSVPALFLTRARTVSGSL
jgi:hypothetical protein